MCRPKKESGTGSLGGTSLVARALLFHNSTEIAARTSNAKRRNADLGAVDMLRVLLSNGGVGFGSLPLAGVRCTRSLPLRERYPTDWAGRWLKSRFRRWLARCVRKRPTRTHIISVSAASGHTSKSVLKTSSLVQTPGRNGPASSLP